MDPDATVARWRSSSAIRPLPELSPEQWARVKEVFHAAVERPLAERRTFVHDNCGDTAVASAVERLLAGDDAAQSFMETPAAARVGPPGPPEAAALMVGQQLGPYTIVARIGVGGMGEVYRARDTKLGRDVAVKVLPASLASHPDRLARFDREARVLATLNHPNIAIIHGIEDAPADTGGHIRAIVMELVDGETLAERLQRGPIPLADALVIARQIANALDAAHEKAIIHRDLKPANITITPTGLVKVLDFGLAKIAAPVEGSAEETRTVADTRQGMVVGTVAYMSPEQARGQTVDKRTDIWAFGCVLYEMLTARRLFEGDGATDTLALVITQEPDWSALPSKVPPAIKALLRRCLDRDRVKRLGDVAAIRFALEDVASSGDQPAAPASGGGTAWRRVALGAGGLIAAVTLIVAFTPLEIWTPRHASEQSPPVRSYPVNLPPGQRLAGLTLPSIAFSPDGSQLAYVATTQGEEARQIYLYSMEHAEARLVPGTEGATNPFFSPDGQWLAFYSRELVAMKVPVTGGVAQSLTNTAIPPGASWGSTHTIAFAPYLSVIQGIREEGGTPEPLTRFENGETYHTWPEFLPGGKALLFSAVSANPTPSIAVQPVGSGERKTLAGQFGNRPHYASSGHVVYAQRGNLMAVPFDLERLEVKDRAVAIPVVPGVFTYAGTAQYSLSSTGALAYVPGNVQGLKSRLVWVSRRDRTEQILSTPEGSHNQPRVSPDGQRLVVDVVEGPDNMQLWLYDVAHDQFTAFTHKDEGVNRHAVWQPDSKGIVFMSNRQPPTQLFWQSADGGGLRRLTNFRSTPTADILPIPYSFCGKDLTFVRQRLASTPELWTLQMGEGPLALGQESPVKLPSIRSIADGGLQLSPDCQWVAYASDESSRREIWVRPFPGLDKRWQISTNGGNEPLWNPRPGTRELFYRIGDKMMAVHIRDDGSPEEKPHELFNGVYVAALNGYVRPNYDVSRDGERFLMLKAVEQVQPLTQINVVLNWVETLKRPAPRD